MRRRHSFFNLGCLDTEDVMQNLTVFKLITILNMNVETKSYVQRPPNLNLDWVYPDPLGMALSFQLDLTLNLNF